MRDYDPHAIIETAERVNSAEDTVLAFRPRIVDYPHFVAEEYGDLAELEGAYVGGEQCDGCGNSTYRIERDERDNFVARCAVDPDENGETRHPEPCGTYYSIRLYNADDVVF